MSISNTAALVGPVIGASYPFNITVFPFQQASDLTVINVGQTGGVIDPPIVLSLNSDYSVSGGNYDSANNMLPGTVTVITGGAHSPAVNDQFYVLRNVPLTQIIQFLNTGNLTAAMIEQGLDKLTTIAQQQEQQITTSLKLESWETDDTVLLKSVRSNNLLGFGPTGTVVLYPISVTTSGIASGTLVVADNSNTPRSLGSRFADVANVLDFGAKGDGVADDSAALNAAVTSLASTGGTVFLPKGTYICSANQFLIPYSNIRVVGAGMGATTIKVTAYLDGIRVANGYPVPSAILSNIEICHLSVNGNVGAFSSPTDTAGNGINVNGCENFSIHHCHVYATSQQGIASTYFPVAGSTQAGGSICDNIVDMSATNSNVGIGVEGLSQRNVVSRNRVTFTTTAGAGIYLGDGGDTNEDNGNSVISDNVIIAANVSAGYGIHLDGNWHGVSVTGNTLLKWQISIRADNIASSNTYGATITGNICREFGQFGIATLPDNGQLRYTTVTGNVLYSTNVSTLGGMTLGNGTTVTGNTIQISGGTGIYAIDGCFISGNYINGPSYGVDLSGASANTTMVAGNYMSAGVNGQFNGIVVNNYAIAAYGTTRIYNEGIDLGGLRQTVSTAAPSTGAHLQGDIVWNSAAAAAGNAGFICVTAGTPGTWKTFGTIAS